MKFFHFFVVLMLVAGSGFAMTENKSPEGSFRFEDYKNEKSFQLVMERKFPVGSNYENLREVFISQGGEELVLNDGRIRLDYKKSYFWMLFSSYHWIVVVGKDEKGRINQMETNFGVTGF